MAFQAVHGEGCGLGSHGVPPTWPVGEMVTAWKAILLPREIIH